MIWSCHLEKLPEVIRGQQCSMPKITLSGSHELRVGVTAILVIIIFIMNGSDRD
jgi:hypothetical protein